MAFIANTLRLWVNWGVRARRWPSFWVNLVCTGIPAYRQELKNNRNRALPAEENHRQQVYRPARRKAQASIAMQF